MEIKIGSKNELSDLIGHDHNIWSRFDSEKEGEYIVHIYSSEHRMELFDRKENGTPLNFVDETKEELEVVDPESYVLPALYGIDKNGKERIWKIWVIGSTVYKTYGEVGGNMVSSTRNYKGVNEDKKNSTTAEEQAKREAERDWVKQLDKDYYAKSLEGKEMEDKIRSLKKEQGGVNVNIDAAIRGRHDEEKSLSKKKAPIKKDIQVDIRPMHCTPWSLEPKCLKYFDFESGVYIQPKLDGVRCIAQVKNGEVLLGTRTGKNMMWLNHIRKDVLRFLTGYETIILDGEIYAHSITGKAEYKGNKLIYSESDEELDADQRFDIISGAARPKRNEPHPLEEQLSYHIFDIADPTGKLDQDARFEILKMLFSRKDRNIKHIHLVLTKVIYYQEEVEEYHDEVFQQDYEGVVIRARDLIYDARRKSLSMRKYKHFITEEYPIVDIYLNDGVERDQFSWVCEKLIKDEDGNESMTTFKAKPKGTREQRMYWYDNQDEFLGKLLTVKFQNFTPEGIPRFPSGLTIRDYE